MTMLNFEIKAMSAPKELPIIVIISAIKNQGQSIKITNNHYELVTISWNHLQYFALIPQLINSSAFSLQP